MSKMCTEPSNLSRLHGCTFSGDTMGTRYSARLFAEPIDQTLVGAALFAAVAANEAERVAPNLTLVDCQMIGASGRVFMSGAMADAERARDHILEVLAAIEGRER